MIKHMTNTGVFRFIGKHDVYGEVVLSNRILEVHSVEESLRALPGDIVECNAHSVIRIIERNNTLITGALFLSSKIILGKTKKGLKQKKFQPSNRSPPYIVASKSKKQTDVYAIIRFKEWTNKTKWPVGTLETIIGDVGDYKTEVEYVRYRHGIRWKNHRFDLQKYYMDLTPDRVDLTHLNTISIDPIGCQDIDDCLHIVETESGYEVGVHIADVTSFVPQDSELDLICRARGTSVYLEQKTYNMMPDELSTQICSLRAEKVSRVFSVILQINNGHVSNVRFHKSLIINKQELSYESANELINTDETITLLYNIGQLMWHRDEPYDIHKTIEVFMIAANKAVAEALVAAVPNLALLRSHKGAKANLRPVPNTHMKPVVEIINQFNMQRATYEIGGSGHHVGLGLKTYTHFTSPIRRYADIIVHRMLWNVISGQEVCDWSLVCDNLNVIQKSASNAERESRRLELIYQIYENDSIFETMGYIVDVDQQYIQIYVPELKIVLSHQIVSQEIEHLVECVVVNDSVCVCSINGTITLRVFDQVLIKVVVLMLESNFERKIQIQMLDPNPLEYVI